MLKVLKLLVFADTDPEVNNREDILTIFFLFIVALGLRTIRLYDLDIWFDEVVLLFQLSGSFVDIWDSCLKDNFPPLYPWILKIWSYLFSSENSLRFFSALLGALTPPAAYLLGKVLDGKRFGLILGLTCCISPALLYYSQMIRMYSIFPLFACFSIIGFIQGMKTNERKYWILTAISNLLGFYTFTFMIYLIMMEFVILLWPVKIRLDRLKRSLVYNIPTLILILFWIGPLMLRYHQLEESFWLKPLSVNHIGELWTLLGTGTDYHDRYTLAVILNVPLLIGFLFGIRKTWKRYEFRISIIIFIGIILIVLFQSLIGPSIFYKRYFMFLIPVYLAIVLAGWKYLKNKNWRIIGLGITYLALVSTLFYYYIGYHEFHWIYHFALSESEIHPNDGHAISKTVAFLQDNLRDDEAVIHYSNPLIRCFSFFPSRYYHDPSSPVYIYSTDKIAEFSGGQYLKEGEWIRSLGDIANSPEGIWIVSLDSTEALFDSNYLEKPRLRGFRWVSRDNLPKEIYDGGYVGIDTIRFGSLTTIHFRRNLESSIP